MDRRTPALNFTAVWRVRAWMMQDFNDSHIPAPMLQMAGWLVLVGLGVVALVNGRLLIALVWVLVARFLPRRMGETVAEG